MSMMKTAGGDRDTERDTLREKVLLTSLPSPYAVLSELLHFCLNYFGSISFATKQGLNFKRVYLSSLVLESVPYSTLS